MKIDNKEVRVKLAEHAAKRDGPGCWETICRETDEHENRECRLAIVVLAKAINEKLEGEKGAINSVKKRMGDKYTAFIRKYNKAYREVEASMHEAADTAEEVPVEAEKVEEVPVEAEKVEEVPVTTPDDDVEFTLAEMNELESIKAALLTKPLVLVYDRYNTLMLPWGAEKARLSFQVIGEKAYAEVLKLRALKEKRLADKATEVRTIGEKIPRSEIDEEAEGGWEIDVEIFYPIAIGVVTGKIGPIAEAIEIFGYAFDGRALPELTGLASIMIMEKYEGNLTKIFTYYSAVVVALGKFSTTYIASAAMAARKRMETILGIEDTAGEVMKTLRAAIIEEGV